MYLTKIIKKTGLLDISDTQDGIYAIKAFRDVLDDPTLGLECLTAIALVVDHLSPKRNYGTTDRPRAAMEEVTGDRDKFVWNQEKIQVALNKYDDLQYNPTIVEGQIHYQRKVSKLKEFMESEKYYNKHHELKDANGEAMIFENPAVIATSLRKINEDIKLYEKQNEGKDLYEDAPTTKNGYSLSRLEQKISKNTSFYNQIR